MFDAKPVIQRLKSYAKEHDMTQSDLAKRIGASATALSRWLNDRASFNPTLKQLIGMADMFGVTLAELLSQENASDPASPEKAKKSKPAAKTSAKATSAKSEDTPKDKPKKSARATKAKTAAAVSKDTKTKKASKTKEAAKKTSKALAKKAAKASAAVSATPEEKSGRPGKAATK